MPRTLSAVSPLAAKKQACRVAYHSAKKADPALAALLDRFHSETLLVMDGAPAAAKPEMWRRMRICFQIGADRATWPLQMSR